jgi:electron transport complex protein RnfC
MGMASKAVIIKADGKDEADYPFEPIKDWRGTSGSELKERVGAAGIVGAGGAAFPAYVKLSPPPEKKIDTLILNGAECEPFLTADHRLMLEHAEGILEGAAILAHILGVKSVFIGIENNKPDAISKMAELAGNYDGIEVVGLRVRYPQGAEKQLIYALTGRKVPTGGLPMDVNCVVQNVGTAFAVKEAVVDGKPLFERITTVTGTPVVNPGNWRLRIGTPVSKVLELAGGVKMQPGKVILGGPMMGFAQKSLDVPIMKNASGILLLAPDEVSLYTSDPCIRCGRCVDACPMNLLPSTISSAAENEAFELAEDYNVMDCIECGCCAYVCPAHRPLVQHFKRCKAEIIAKRRKK